MVAACPCNTTQGLQHTKRVCCRCCAVLCRRQRRAARADANNAFNTLLSELVREPGTDFEFWLPKLKKDPLVS